MSVTEQQFIQAYSQMDADKQQKAYNAGNAQVRSWIDAYNASQNTGNNNSNYTSYSSYDDEDYGEGYSNYQDQGYYSSGAYNDVGGINVGYWNYGIDTPERQQEIIRNLNQAYSEDPNRFSNWDTFARNFNYAYSGRSEMERETMRNWYQQNIGNVPEGTPSYGSIYGGYNPNDTANTDYFFGLLLQGNPVSGTGAAVAAAQNRYRNYQSLSAMTPDQISSAVLSGALNPVGQDMIDLKNYSPALYAQVQAQLQGQTEVNDINAAGQGIYNGLTGTETNGNYTKYNFTTEYAKNASVIKQYNESLYKKIEGLGGDTAAYVAIVASMLQNPLIQANKDEIENLEGEINKIQENIYTIGDSARAALGSEAPEDLVSAYISHQTKQLQNQLRTAQNSLLVAQGKLDNQLSEVETLIDAINNGIELEGGIGTGGNNYQYVSGTKYQQAGYFNKATGEFIPLSGTGSSGSYGGGSGGGTGGTGTGGGANTADTHNYQDDSAGRLQEIANNLANYAKTNPELFKDRDTFNNFFKYNQRSQAQKNVLNAAWLKYGKKIGAGSVATGAGGTSTGTGTTDNSLVNAIKKDLINRTVNFSSTSMKKTYGSYGTQAQSWDEDTTNDYLQEIGKISSLSELKSMLGHLSKEANKTALLAPLRTKVIKELQAIEGEGKNETERAADKKKKQNEKLRSYAVKLGTDATTLATRWGLLKK